MTVSRRRMLLVCGGGVFGWGAASGLSGCARLFGPRTIEISQEELLQKLATQFPMRKQVLEVFELTASTPSLRMVPDDDRVATVIPFTARDRLVGSTFAGSVGLSFGLRFEPRDLTLRLRDAKVDSVDIGALPKGATTRLGVWLAEEKLRDFAIHRFKPEDLRTADRLGYQVDSIKVAKAGLVVRLVPRPEAPEASSATP